MGLLFRLLLHMRSRIAEVRAQRALDRAGLQIARRVLFRRQQDRLVRKLKASADAYSD